MMNYFEVEDEPEPIDEIENQIRQGWFSIAFWCQLTMNLPVEDIFGADLIAETYPKTKTLQVTGQDNRDGHFGEIVELELLLDRKTFIEIGKHSFLIHWGSRIDYPATFAFWVDPLYWVFDRNREIVVPRDFFTASVN